MAQIAAPPSTAPEGVDPEDIRGILEKHTEERGRLTAVLEEIQDKYGYLPEEALRTVSEATGRSLVDIYGVATFYHSFSLKPRGKHLVSVCLGTACHVRGAPKVAEELKAQLGIEPGETTPDKEFTLETVNCLGACALGPVVVIDGRYFSKVRRSKVRALLDRAVEGFDKIEPEKDLRIFPIEVGCPKCGHSLMDETFAIDDHPSVQVTVAAGGERGWLRFSSLYGSDNVCTEHEIAAASVADFFCPHCHAELAGGSHCRECGTAMVPMAVRGGGVVQFCTRWGCRGHRLDIETMSH